MGGGLLGLEAAKAVYDLESIPFVSIINRQAFPLSRQLDADAGELVLHRIEALGVQVLTNTTVSRMLTNDAGAFCGFELGDGSVLDAQLVIFAIGISPRDDLAKSSGINCHPRGGIIVNDSLETSVKDVYAIGECASWRGNTYGLIAPGGMCHLVSISRSWLIRRPPPPTVEMADILSFNFTQTNTSAGSFKPRVMNDPDLSTKLKLMGVDVASFGDFFADKRMKDRIQETRSKRTELGNILTPVEETPKIKKRVHRTADERREDPIKCLTYKDPFSSVYKKYAACSPKQMSK